MCLMYTHCDYMMVMCCVFIQDGWNALHCAARGGHEEIFTFLFNHHPDLFKATSNVSDVV